MKKNNFSFAITILATLTVLFFSACKKDHIELPETDQAAGQYSQTLTDTGTGQVSDRSNDCPTGDVVLTSQSEIDSFAQLYPNCTVIDGSLEIKQSTTGGKIANLSDMSFLLEVAGNLIIENTTELQNLDGLQNITQIGRDLIIANNDKISTLLGLEGLIVLGGALVVTDNPQLYICDEPGICDHLANGGQTTISNNAPGCDSKQEVEGACNGQPACSAPVNSWVTNILPHRATVNWDVVAGASQYKIRYRISQSSNTWKIKQSTNDRGVVRQLQANTTYVYQLKTECPNGWTNWSQKWYFTTAPQ